MLLRARPPGRPERGWLAFDTPLAVLAAYEPGEVLPVVTAAEEAARDGAWAVGFVSYEAAPAFDQAFVTRPAADLPLAWFGVFAGPRELLEPPPAVAPAEELEWSPSVSPNDYERSIAEIHRLIAAGDTYQVNFTWRLDAPFAGDPWALFHRLAARSPTDHAVYLDTGRHVIASASPELFFRLEAGRLTCRPMKGTRPRGRTVAEDRVHALALYDSPKDRAENLMIVDMVRNDLGRLARPGTVRVDGLFDLERHDTVFQLTSTVTAETDATPRDVLTALFPCASVTGAPKVRTMEIIADLEDDPRGIYTGAIGYLAPGGHAEMGVAIRTVWIDRERGRARYGTGGGIVWDSRAGDEYRECLAKTRVLAGSDPELELLETLLWRAGEGYRLLERHLDRLAVSAEYFGFRLSRERVVRELDRLATALDRDGVSQRVVRLLAGNDGELKLDTRSLDGPHEHRWRLALATRPVDERDRFLFHKTTRREVYDRARAAAPGYDDVLLWNAAGDLTESTRANVAVRRDGTWTTPPVEAGLLAGCERQERVERAELQVGPVPVTELERAEDVALLNSVRGWIAVDSVSDPQTGRTIWRAAAERNPDPEDP